MKAPNTSGRQAGACRAGYTGLLRGDRGSVIPLAAFLIAVILGFAALVIDLGWLSVVRGELQNAADAGALAGVVELVNNGEDTAQALAVNYTTQPAHFRLTTPAPAADAVDVTVLGPETLQVRVRRASGTTAGAVATIFAGLWGTRSVEVEAVAVATLNRRITGTGPGNLLPFGVRKALLDEDRDGNYDVGKTIDIYPRDKSAGNFGLLDLNGRHENTNEDIIDWIENGYPGSFAIPHDPGYINLEGDPGISGGPLSGATRLRLDDMVVFPVFDQVAKNKGETIYRVVDFVGGIIKDFEFHGEKKHRKLKIEITGYSSQNLITGITPPNNTVSTPVLIR